MSFVFVCWHKYQNYKSVELGDQLQNHQIYQNHQIRVWQIFGYSNIFRYKYLFVSYSYDFFDTIKFGYWFVWFFDKYIFGYSIILFFWYKYIRILIRIIFWYEYIQEKNLAWGPKSPKVKWLKLFTHRSIQNYV